MTALLWLAVWLGLSTMCWAMTRSTDTLDLLAGAPRLRRFAPPVRRRIAVGIDWAVCALVGALFTGCALWAWWS
jgi:hypothetical protein